MPAKSASRRKPSAILAAGAEEAMTPAQRRELKELTIAAYEHDAFSGHLTQTDAARRIAMLKAKLKLMDGPPHTL